MNVNKTNGLHEITFRFKVCNGCHELMQKAMTCNDVANVSVKGSDYRIHFWYIFQKMLI